MNLIITRWLLMGYLLAFIPCCSQRIFSPMETGRSFRIGDSTINIRISDYGGPGNLVFINVHDDELTAVAGAIPSLQTFGGLMLRIDNNQQRIIRFTMDGKEYGFDPNRMFSRNGIVHTLIRNGRISNQSIERVEAFAQFFLGLIPQDATHILALHNNTDGRLAISSFNEGQENAEDAARLHVNEQEDPDNFFLTTDSLLFNSLSPEFNIVLQDNQRVRDDGSLSVWYRRSPIPYLNCETEHGSQAEFERMMEAAMRVMARKPTEE